MNLKKAGTVEVAEEPDKEIDKDPPPEDENANQQQEDPYVGMSESQKEKFIALEESNTSLQHRIDSDNGRVGAFQRKVNSLEEEIQSIKLVSEKPQPTSDDIKDAMATDEGWEKFSEDYPEVATAIDGRLSTHRQEIDKSMGEQADEINSTLAPVVEKQEQEDLSDAYSEVAEQFPEWQNTVNDGKWHEWLSTQPAAVQSITSTGTVEETISLFGLYDNFRVASGMEPLRNTDHSESESVVDNAASDLERKREQQLEDGATISSRSARIDPNAESGSEFEEAFNVFAKRQDAKRLA